MHLHWLSILHGSISPVGKARDCVNVRADVWCVQNNILITPDGQACLGDFAIAASFEKFSAAYLQPETLRYMAPERFLSGGSPCLVDRPSKESDVYSLAMASFSVCALLESILLLDTNLLLQSGPHGGIAVSWKKCGGDYQRYSYR